MPVHDDLGIRMKENYEMRGRSYLTKRTPVIIRIDGRAFHTFTRGFNKPYDKLLMATMQETMKFLCENIQGCVLGYTQSDEISLLLIDYKRLETDSWFDYQTQKVCSISASMATLAFNKIFNEYSSGIDPTVLGHFENFKNEEEYIENDFKDELELLKKFELFDLCIKDKEKFLHIIKAYIKARGDYDIGTIISGAMFDSRCFNIPPEEVTNYFYWRQEDATRNSIQMAGQSYFSHKQLQNKSCNDIQDMLHEEKGINWNNYITDFKRGSCCIKIPKEIETEHGTVIRGKWEIDHNIPIFSGEGRKYIDNLLKIEE